MLHDYECPLVSFLLWIVTRLSVLYPLFMIAWMVANLKRGIHPEGFQEQKLTNEKTLHFKHDVLLKRVLCVMHVLFQLCNVLQIEPS